MIQISFQFHLFGTEFGNSYVPGIVLGIDYSKNGMVPAYKEQ